MYKYLCTLAATLLFSTSCLAASINWHSYSSNVFKRAKSEHKMILIFGQAEWCPWCRKMQDYTYRDNSVVALINKHYIPVKVDIDNNANVANGYNISVVPKTVITDENGREIDSVTGYIDSYAMVKFLRTNAN